MIYLSKYQKISSGGYLVFPADRVDAYILLMVSSAARTMRLLLSLM